MADKTQMRDAVRQSEDVHIEQVRQRSSSYHAFKELNMLTDHVVFMLFAHVIIKLSDHYIVKQTMLLSSRYTNLTLSC